MIPAPWMALAFKNRDRLLDLYPAAVAYSLRKIKKNVTKCMSVRTDRSGASPDTIDIGFTSSGELDQAALLAHCGSDNGFVVTWYNQATDGASGNFTQATAAQQPSIVTSGAVLTRYGKPMIQMDTTSKYLYCEDLTLFKNKDYNRIYFTLSKPDVYRYDDMVPLGLRSPLGFDRVLLRFGWDIPTGRDLYASAQTGASYNLAQYWFLFDESTSPGAAKFGGSVSTLNVMANWNSTSSGVADVCRRGVCTRHENDVVTNSTVGGTETANSYNETASIFTLGGWWNGSAIQLVATGLGYNELVIYTDAAQHGNDSAISANIAAYY